MPHIWGLDPGQHSSAIVCYDGTRNCVIRHDYKTNLILSKDFRSLSRGGMILVIEEMRARPNIGQSVLDTCVWIGRFIETFPGSVLLLPRQSVAKSLLNFKVGEKHGDKEIRAALLDLFPPTGGGAVPQVGTSKKPGPLFGMSSHKWAALAVAVVASRKLQNGDT